MRSRCRVEAVTVVRGCGRFSCSGRFGVRGSQQPEWEVVAEWLLLWVFVSLCEFCVGLASVVFGPLRV